MRHPYMDPALREHFVYRCYDADGRLLYVGCTRRPDARWRQHKADRHYWTADVARTRMAGPYNYDTAREIERVALRDEYPIHAVTPQRISAKNRRYGWVRRRAAELLVGIPTPSFEVLIEAYDKAEAEADGVCDWDAIAEAFIAKRRVA